MTDPSKLSTPAVHKEKQPGLRKSALHYLVAVLINLGNVGDIYFEVA
jgi:hypothetical protein